MTLSEHRRRLRYLGTARAQYRNEAPPAARKAREAGLSVAEIARLLGLTRAGVYNLMGKEK